MSEPVAWEKWSVGRPDLRQVQYLRPELTATRRMRRLYAVAPAGRELIELCAKVADEASYRKGATAVEIATEIRRLAVCP